MLEKFLISIASKLTIGAGKYVYNNSGERRRRKEAIGHYGNRGIVEIVILYFIGLLICGYLVKRSWIGLVVALLGYLGKIENLKEASQYVDVSREKAILMIVGIILTVYVGYLYLPLVLHKII